MRCDCPTQQPMVAKSGWHPFHPQAMKPFQIDANVAHTLKIQLRIRLHHHCKLQVHTQLIRTHTALQTLQSAGHCVLKARWCERCCSIKGLESRLKTISVLILWCCAEINNFWAIAGPQWRDKVASTQSNTQQESISGLLHLLYTHTNTHKYICIYDFNADPTSQTGLLNVSQVSSGTKTAIWSTFESHSHLKKFNV